MTAAQTTEMHGPWDQLITTQTCMVPKKIYTFNLGIILEVKREKCRLDEINIYLQG
jgi:hypothetical protein